MLRSARPRGALCALLLSVAGCYTGTAPYVRPHAQIRSDPARLLAAVQETAHAEGLRVLRVNPERGLVVAVSAASSGGLLVTREHWRFSVRAGDVAVEMHPESRAEDEGEWQRDTQVCDCYHYAREQELLQAIRARLGRGPASRALAQAGRSDARP